MKATCYLNRYSVDSDDDGDDDGDVTSKHPRHGLFCLRERKKK